MYTSLINLTKQVSEIMGLMIILVLLGTIFLCVCMIVDQIPEKEVERAPYVKSAADIQKAANLKAYLNRNKKV